MKILHTIPFFSDEYGGSVEITKHQIEELIKRGIEVSVLTSKTPNQNIKNENTNNPSKHILFLNSIFSLGMYYFTPTIIPYLRKLDFQILHGHLYRNFQTDSSILYAKFKKIPIILSPHGAIPYVNRTLIKRFYDRITLHSILNAVDVFLAETNFEKESLIQFGISPPKIKYIPNGIDTSFFRRCDDSVGSIKLKYNITESKIITYVGRLDRIKGLFFLLKVFKELMHEFQDFKLLLVGEDFGIKENLQKFANKLNLQKKVLFLGFQPKNTLKIIYNASDIVVLPSRYESAGLSILESAACEKPVIGSNTGGIQEYIIDNWNGFLVDYGAIKIWKEKILYLLKNEDIAREFGKNGRRLVENKFNWTRIGKLLETLYFKLINN